MDCTVAARAEKPAMPISAEAEKIRVNQGYGQLLRQYARPDGQ
jgi:hypothetical protein